MSTTLQLLIGFGTGIGIVAVAYEAARFVIRVQTRKALANFEAVIREAVKDGFAEGVRLAELERAYTAYINGDTGERYTAEELA